MQSTYNIKAPSLGQAHETILKYILEKGELITTEDGELTIETGTVCIFVEHPETEPISSPNMMFGEKFNKKYGEDLVYGTDSDFEYDYHTRLFQWGCCYDFDSDPIETDQIDYIIKKLLRESTSRRAIAITWVPPEDTVKKDVPCLQLVQCIIRERLLHMRVVFRSNDMLSAAGSNMYGLVELQKFIAAKTNTKVGSYTHISLVPHVYYKRDVSYIPAFCKHGGTIQPNRIVCKECKECYRWLVNK